MNVESRSADDSQASAADMLALMEGQRRSVRAKLDRRFSVLLVVWAAAWAIGFFALWSGERIGGNPLFRIPELTAWLIFGSVMVAGIVWSIVTGILSGRGFRGVSRLSGALYGWSWSVSMMGAGLFTAGLQREGMSDELAALLYPGLFVTLVGVLYLTGAALQRSPAQFALGCVMILIVVIATYVGTPTHYLIYATAGPVAMLAVAALQLRGVLPALVEESQ
ncbi:hypothetical protein [Demequina globuliformis]|uniref:hypothetical protein n=1 Tax=Demequina globuliformis TaxID=676202 RepID=UPI0007816F82|nr:hypothetical protein [Demequina globuliformis]